MDYMVRVQLQSVKNEYRYRDSSYTMLVQIQLPIQVRTLAFYWILSRLTLLNA